MPPAAAAATPLEELLDRQCSSQGMPLPICCIFLQTAKAAAVPSSLSLFSSHHCAQPSTEKNRRFPRHSRTAQGLPSRGAPLQLPLRQCVCTVKLR